MNRVIRVLEEALERSGKKLARDFIIGGIPGAVDGLLEDVELAAEEFTRRTKRARSRIAQRRKDR
jgi:hypothetical protein